MGRSESGDVEPARPIVSVTIADCRVDCFRGSGAGGQKRNKTSSAVRVTHEPSGAVGECSEGRSQPLNKRTAFLRMARHPKFTLWLKQETARRTGELASIERAVEASMSEHHIVTETRVDGRWTRTDELSNSIPSECYVEVNKHVR